MTCLVLLEAFTESKQLLQTPQPPCPALVQVSGWFRRLGSSDFHRAFRFYRMDTRWQHNLVHLWDFWLSTCVHLAVLIKYSVSPSPLFSQFQASSPPAPPRSPQIRNRGCRPTDPVRIPRWRDLCQLRLGGHLGRMWRLRFIDCSPRPSVLSLTTCVPHGTSSGLNFHLNSSLHCLGGV